MRAFSEIMRQQGPRKHGGPGKDQKEQITAFSDRLQIDGQRIKPPLRRMSEASGPTPERCELYQSFGINWCVHFSSCLFSS